MNPDKTVSAQVVLAAASGARPGPRSRITSANIHEWVPSPEAIARVTGALRDMGFEVGKCIGNSCSIAGPVRLFELSFRTKLRETVDGGVQFADRGLELSGKKIPAGLKALIATITFMPPQDFGPGTSSFA